MSISTPPQVRVALVCNFFYPRLGGVEMHIWSLAQCLVKMGHKVIIITNSYPGQASTTTHATKSKEGAAASHQMTSNTRGVSGQSKRTGVRYLPGPVKVYYCPILEMVDGTSFPTYSATFPLLRWIFIREGIELVHAHQATSTLGHEALMYASEMGLATVYTDHSLFGFDDFCSVVLNKVLKTVLSVVDACICVSHTCRENLILRASLDSSAVYAIPNAVDTSKFTPDPSRPLGERINIVVVSRLVYRKGVDLLVGIIPQICQDFPLVDFIIGGNGTKRLALEEMVEREQLQDRVEFLGAVAHESVRDVLVRGHLFLNCSLTESFCIALLEAASCGLFVVSTDVGGVPEVLPSDMVLLSEPSVSSLVKTVSFAIKNKIKFVDPVKHHERVRRMYSWDRVACQTVEIYHDVMKKPRLTLLQRIERLKTMGPFGGYLVCILALILHFSAMIVEWWQPREIIDVVPDLCPKNNQSDISPEKAGSHLQR